MFSFSFLINFFLKKGGALGIPSWGKFWLAAMNLYEWEGVVPLLPELWILPYAAPIFPGRLWCHARMVYLPMSFIFGSKFSCPLTKLIFDLRKEIYCEDYDSINWSIAFKRISPLDYWKKHGFILKLVTYIEFFYEKIHSKWIREKALQETLKHIRYEDEQTNWIDIGPVIEKLFSSIFKFKFNF